MPSAGAIKAGSAFIELSLTDSKFFAGLKAAEKGLANFGRTMTSLGASIQAAGAAIATPFLLAANHFREVGDALGDMSSRTGVGVEALSELGYAATQTGTDLANLAPLLIKMQRTIAQAAMGSDSAVDSFNELGLSVASLSELTPDQQFEAIAEALSNVEDPAKRISLAMDLLGKSAAQVFPLIAKGAAGIRALRSEGRGLGVVVGALDAEKAQEMDDAFNRLKATFSALRFTIGASLAEPLTNILNSMAKAIALGIQWANDNRRLIASLAAGGAVIFGVGAAITSLGIGLRILSASIGGISSLFKTLGSAVAFVLNPMVLMIATVAALGVTLLQAFGLLDGVVKSLGTAVGTLVKDFQSAFEVIAMQLASGDIAAAAKLLWLTIKIEFQTGVAAINKIWLGWKAFFLTAWSEAVAGLAGFFIEASATIQSTWVKTTGFLLDTWTKTVSGVLNAWNTVEKFIATGILKLAKLLDSSFDLEGAIGQLNEDFANRERQVTAQRDRTLKERQAARDEKLAGIEDIRQGASAAIDADLVRQIEAINQAESTGLQENQRQVRQLREQLRKSLEEAKRVAATAFPERGKEQAPETDEDFAAGMNAIVSKALARQQLAGAGRIEQTLGIVERSDIEKQQLAIQKEQLATQKQLLKKTGDALKFN